MVFVYDLGSDITREARDMLKMTSQWGTDGFPHLHSRAHHYAWVCPRVLSTTTCPSWEKIHVLSTAVYVFILEKLQTKKEGPSWGIISGFQTMLGLEFWSFQGLGLRILMLPCLDWVPPFPYLSCLLELYQGKNTDVKASGWKQREDTAMVAILVQSWVSSA